MVDSVEIHFCTDPGHGWALVTVDLVEELGISDQISEYSYRKGEVVALEEDCDYGLLVDALNSRQIPFTVVEVHAKDHTHIRQWNRFTVRRSRTQHDMFTNHHGAC